MAVIFPPGWTRADVLRATARADQAIVRFGGFANIGIIQSNSDHAVDNLRREGAWLVLPPGALGACFITLTAPPSRDTNAQPR